MDLRSWSEVELLECVRDILLRDGPLERELWETDREFDRRDLEALLGLA